MQFSNVDTVTVANILFTAVTTAVEKLPSVPLKPVHGHFVPS